MPQAVSVVIPSYNGAAYIEEALASVFAQTLPPAEVIVVDDCSTDGTPQLVRREQATAPMPVRLIRLAKNCGGPAQPLNIGVQSARSPFISFLDQDDRMHPQKLETLAPLLQQHPTAGLAFGQGQNMSAEGLIQPGPADCYDCYPPVPTVIPADQAFRLLVQEGYKYGGAGGILIRKEAWRRIGKFDRRNAAAWDYDFALRLALSGWGAAYHPSTVFYHRLHARSLSGSRQGLLVSTGWTRAKLRCFRHPRLASEARSALVASLQGVTDYGYWDRVMGNYSTAIRNNLAAAVHLPHKAQALLGAAKTCWVTLADAIWDQALPSRPRPWRPEVIRSRCPSEASGDSASPQPGTNRL